MPRVCGGCQFVHAVFQKMGENPAAERTPESWRTLRGCGSQSTRPPWASAARAVASSVVTSTPSGGVVSGFSGYTKTSQALAAACPSNPTVSVSFAGARTPASGTVISPSGCRSPAGKSRGGSRPVATRLPSAAVSSQRGTPPMRSAAPNCATSNRAVSVFSGA